MSGELEAGPVFAALKLKNRADRMVRLLRLSSPTLLIEKEWNLIHQAYDELRDGLEKKVSEG